MKYLKFFTRHSKSLGCYSIIAVILLSFSACRKPETTSHITQGPALPAQLYSYANGDNNVATLGRVLFYEKSLSLDKSVACGSCHQPLYGFSDNKVFSTGAGGAKTTRNALAIINTANSRFWDGKMPSYDDAASIPLNSHIELNMTDAKMLTGRISALPYYAGLFQNAFGGSSISVNNVKIALTSFLDNIVSTSSKFDQCYPNGLNAGPGTQNLSANELAGLNLFLGKAKCVSCHDPNNGFGGGIGQFADIGLDANYSDFGRGNISFSSTDNGKFQVPSLKNIALSAPYMHDGRFASLNDVLNFFCGGIKQSPNLSYLLEDQNGIVSQISLSDTEKQNLIAFLQTLTDQGQVNDPKFSNPFVH